MTTVSLNDIKDFAERVELLCDFLISKAQKDGRADILVIQKLKERAADIQAANLDEALTDLTITGLDKHMRGHL